MARASDKLANAVEVLCDQKHYRDSLEYQVRRKEDWKGMVMSKILRAGSVVKAKVKEVQDKESRLDWDLLKQIRMLLENEDKCLAEKST
ncbi:hypothetical protein CEXT_409021 [Caerostris extrusa]|uniref:Uncharacterized protein n=1 Tax=Caerostris extrusa TaxID=172846 RepID=A0AAV4WB15_CAEEX|nr:hypothetical protein CEXT_409021 [Caerostris extrusa]